MRDDLVRIRFYQITFPSLIKIGVICNAFLWVPIWAYFVYIFLAAGETSGVELIYRDGYAHGAQVVMLGVFYALICIVLGTIALILGGVVARMINHLVSFGGISYHRVDDQKD